MLGVKIIDEFYIFLIAINYGLIIGGIYDFYRVFRQFSKQRKLLAALEDLFFWIITALIIFIFLVNKTDGIIRGFVVLGFLIGYAFYMKVISKYSYALLKKIFELILGLISEIISLITYPFRKLFVTIGKRINKVGMIIKMMLKDARKYIKIRRKKK